MGLWGSLWSGDNNLLKGLVLAPLEHCSNCCVKDIGCCGTWGDSLGRSPCLLEWLDPVKFELDLLFELWLPNDTHERLCCSDHSAVPGYNIADDGFVSAVEAEKLNKAKMI